MFTCIDPWRHVYRQPKSSSVRRRLRWLGGACTAPGALRCTWPCDPHCDSWPSGTSGTTPWPLMNWINRALSSRWPGCTASGRWDFTAAWSWSCSWSLGPYVLTRLNILVARLPPSGPVEALSTGTVPLGSTTRASRASLAPGDRQDGRARVPWRPVLGALQFNQATRSTRTPALARPPAPQCDANL